MVNKSYEQVELNALSEAEQSLLYAASKVMDNAHNPYSKFHVGAALLTEEGKIIEGTNYENAAYGSTICAERAAILRANAEGHRDLKAIAIIGKGADFDSQEPTSPCGACRQVIFEASQVGDYDIDVLMSNTQKTKIYKAKISQLLPLAFGPKDLNLEI